MRKVAISIMFLIQSCIPSYSESPLEINYGKWSLFIGYKNQLPHCIMKTHQDSIDISIMYTADYVRSNWIKHYIMEFDSTNINSWSGEIEIDFRFLSDAVQAKGHNNNGKIVVAGDNFDKMDDFLNLFFRHSLMGVEFHNTYIPKKQIDIGGTINMKRSFEFCVGIVDEYGKQIIISPELHLKNFLIDSSEGNLIHRYKE